MRRSRGAALLARLSVDEVLTALALVPGAANVVASWCSGTASPGPAVRERIAERLGIDARAWDVPEGA